MCGAAELDRLARAPERADLLWSYWAAKESAYKALRTVLPGLCFAPRQFAVELSAVGPGAWRGRVYADGRRVRVRLRRTSDYVHAVARVEGDPGTGAGTSPRLAVRVGQVGSLLPAQSSAAARALLAEVLAQRLGCAPGAIEIARRSPRGMPPSVRVGGAIVPVDVSLSHHGRFVAAACVLSTRPMRVEYAPAG